MKNRLLSSAVLSLAFLARPVQASWTADNLDGTYTNPILNADYPDNDVIRVGDWYYDSTTTMQNMPGCHILKSRDLVNWEPVGGVIKSIDDPNHRLEGGWVYGGGPWASSLKYHEKNKKFYSLTACNNLAKTLLSCADQPEGPWTTIELKDKDGKDVFLYDASLFFDDDGNNYVISQRETPSAISPQDTKIPAREEKKKKVPFSFDDSPSDPSYIRVTRLADDCLSVVERPSKLYRALNKSGEPEYTEGLRCYKVNGSYYILAIGENPQVAFRGKSLASGEGWELKRGVLADRYNSSQGFPAQASMVQTQTGEWWAIAHHNFQPTGRKPVLIPVKWVDGWPMFGPKGDGKAVTTYTKPNVGAAAGQPSPHKTSDRFEGPNLKPIWEWNHNPDDTKWSLTESPGALRLKTATVIRNEADIFRARNTLLQRCQGPASVGTVDLKLAQMQEGDVAGLCNFQNPYAYIGVKVEGGAKKLIMVNNGTRVAELPLNQDTVSLRFDYREVSAKSDFFYSLDGVNFTKLGNTLVTYPMSRLPVYTFNGNKYGLFNFATKGLGGSVDFRNFRMFNPSIGNRFSAFSRIEAERYDDRNVSDFQDAGDDVGGKDQATLNSKTGDWLSFHNVSFAGGADAVTLRVRTRKGATAPGKVSVFLDGMSGPPIAQVDVPVTDGAWADATTLIPVTTGRHSVHLVFGDANTDLSSFTFRPLAYQAAFRTADGRQLDASAKLSAAKDQPEIYFSIEPEKDDLFAIKAPNGKHLTVGPDGQISATAAGKGEMELFSFTDLGGANQVALISQGKLQFLKSAGDRLVAAADEWNEATLFTCQLESTPSPRTKTIHSDTGSPRP